MRHFTIFILLLGCCCCNQHRQVSPLKSYQVETAIDMESKTVWLDSISDSISIIPLETSDNITIGQFKDAKLHKNLLFVSHNTPGQPFKLSVFGLNGKYLWDIGSMGHGPGEYNSVWDYFFNNDKVYIHDYMRFAVLCYTLDGKFIKKISYSPHLGNIANITFLDKDIIVGSLSLFQGNETRIVFLNENGILLDSIKFEPHNVQYASGGGTHFFKYSGNQYFSENWDDTVFFIRKDLKVFPKYILNKGIYTVNFKDFVEYGEKYRNAKKVLAFFENDKFILLQGGSFGYHGYICIDKELDEVNKVRFFYNQETCRSFRKVVEYANNPFLKNPVLVDDGSPTFGIAGFSTDNTIWIGAEKPLNEEDNPIIILIHLKK